jgi:hypothetical protein
MTRMTTTFGQLLLLFVVVHNASAYRNCMNDSECRRQICYKWTDICGEGGTCIQDLENGYPYFRCDCSTGFVNLTPDACIHSTLQVTPGGAMAMGGTCLDDTECDSNGACTLMGGSVYKCQCNEGYVGNGYICSSKQEDQPETPPSGGAADKKQECPPTFCTGNGASCVFEPENNKAYCICSDTTRVGAKQDCD